MNKEKVLAKYLPRLTGFISRFVENEEERETIFQETLISALESWPAFSKKSSFYTWLCAIAKHETADFYRKKKIKTLLFSRLPWLEELASEALGPEQIFLRKEFEEEVKAALNSLTAGYREILRLKYYQGLTVDEIARKLNETISAIESRLFRARRSFAKAFASHPPQGGLSYLS